METILKATGIDGSNVIVFDAVGFAEMVANKAKELNKEAGGTELAHKYLETMKLEIKMENCTATFDNTTKSR